MLKQDSKSSKRSFQHEDSGSSLLSKEDSFNHSQREVWRKHDSNNTPIGSFRNDDTTLAEPKDEFRNPYRSSTRDLYKVKGEKGKPGRDLTDDEFHARQKHWEDNKKSHKARILQENIGELKPNIFDKDRKIDTLEHDKVNRQINKHWLENASVEDVLIYQIKDKQLLKDKTKHKSLKQKMSSMHKQLKNSTVISDHYEKHQEKYERAQKTLIPFIIGGSFIVMILELFYNYIMFYKTMIAVAPGLSKFYYSWALLTYVLYFTGGILFITETEQFFYRPYFFWFIAFASFVLMITSFVVEAVAVAEIKEEPKRKAVQIPVVIDMVFGILLCIFSFYFSYSLYECKLRVVPTKCLSYQ